MKNLFKLFIFLSLVSTISFANNIVIVSNKNIQDLTKNQIKAIYLKKLSFINGIKVVPVNLSVNNKLRAMFEKKILDMSSARIKAYWTKEHYLGHRPPVNMKSGLSAKKFVKNVDGAIAYIDEVLLDDELKVLYKLDTN